MNGKRIGLMAILIVVAAFTIWQHAVMRCLRSENDELRARVAEGQGFREENARLREATVESVELQRMRDGQSELLRLRGQVSQLRQRLADEQSASAKRAAAPPSNSVTNADQPNPPVETYRAVVRAAVGWQQTVIAGGWTMPSGKRGLVFIQPQSVPVANEGEPRQVMVQARLVESPAEVLSGLGLSAVNSQDRESSAYTILDNEQTEALIKTLEQSKGVDLLSAPSIVTLDHRQAQIKLTSVHETAAGETYETGPLIDIVPHVTADGSSVDLTIIAQLRLATNPLR